MNLELAKTLGCDTTGCQVQIVKSDEVITTQFSDLVRDQIQIRRGQLVAINHSAPTPEIVWRWVEATVVELNDTSVGIKGSSSHAGFLNRMPELELDISEGDTVWCCNTDEGAELHDISLDGMPANPDRLLAYIAPIVERVYSSAV